MFQELFAKFNGYFDQNTFEVSSTGGFGGRCKITSTCNNELIKWSISLRMFMEIDAIQICRKKNKNNKNSQKFKYSLMTQKT